MKFVAFLKTDVEWDGVDWVYALFEDRGTNVDFFLIEAKTAEIARSLASDEFYQNDFRAGGSERIAERAFDALCGFEYEDEQEIFEYFGEKDGYTVLEFFEKYGWENMFNDKITFYQTWGGNRVGHFTKEDRDKLFGFEPKNLEKLYKRNIRYDILLAPISKEIKEKAKN